VFSSPSELSNRIRWTGITSLQVPRIDLAISGGVHSGEDIVKSILAGATAVEVCSAIYQGGTPAIQQMLTTLDRWMTRHDMESIAQFKGQMNAQQAGGYTQFERTQFMKYFSSRED
jgi:dihydroorotate dehydrogenase (fumarate)